VEDHKSLCPINLSLEVFGDKWSLLIIRDMMFMGKRYFREFLQSEEKIATNILTTRLAMLEQEGIITKADDPDHKLKFIYSLTKKGIDLLPIMAEIGAWGMKYQPYDKIVHGHAEQIVKGGKEVQEVIKKQLAKTHLK
jgi:DNA-binding HxlR family transcriptional regulator